MKRIYAMVIVITVSIGLQVQTQRAPDMALTMSDAEPVIMTRDEKLAEFNRRLQVVLDFEPSLVSQDVKALIQKGHGTTDRLEKMVLRLEKAVDNLAYARSKNLGTAGLINKKVDELERRMHALFAKDIAERKSNPSVRKRDSLELTLHHGSQPMVKLKKIKVMLAAAPTLADVPLDDIVANLLNIDELFKGYEVMYSDASIRARKENVE
jgi:hypothetical protein